MVANFVARLTTLGYDDNFISAMACTARYLIDNAAKLSCYKESLLLIMQWIFWLHNLQLMFFCIHHYSYHIGKR